MKLIGDITKSEKKFFTQLLEVLPTRKLWVDWFYGGYWLFEDVTDAMGVRHEMMVICKATTSSAMTIAIAKIIASSIEGE